MIITEYEQALINFIVDRIDSLRVEQSYSIYELAQRADLSENTLKKVYKKQGFPNVFTIYRLCQAFNITLSEFFMLDKNKRAFSKKELELLERFSQLSPKAQDALLEISRYLT